MTMKIKARFTKATALLSGLFISASAFASGTGGGGLPWEAPLKSIADSITGPVALFISLIAFTIAGATLVFGGELSEFARRSILVVLAVSFIALAAQFMSILFGVGGALI